MSQKEVEEKDRSLILLTVTMIEEEIEDTIEMKEVEAMITAAETMTIIEGEALGETTTITGEAAIIMGKMGKEAMEIEGAMAIIAAKEAVVVIEMTQGAKRKI